MPDRTRLDRRGFIKGAAVAASSLPFMSAASYGRVLGANARLNIGAIGVGGMGQHHLRNLMGRTDSDNVVVSRVCDVYRRRVRDSCRIIERDESAGTLEYREVLDDNEIDCVLIATPDHWHVKISIEAMDSGKDVYVEKPLSHTIEQALACRDAVRRTGRTLQVGPQMTSDGRVWAAREAIRRGRIGKPVWSQASYCRNSRGGQFNWPIEPDASPTAPKDSDGYVWWDRWLGWEDGLAERIDWNADHFFRFRKYFAYNGGLATDLLYHRLAPILLAINGSAGEYPKRVVASGGRYLEKDERDIPDTFMMMADYPSEHTVVLASVMTNDDNLPMIIRGQHGSLDVEPKLQIREQGTWANEFRSTNSDRVGEMIRAATADGGEAPRNGSLAFDLDPLPRRDQKGNFFDAIREGSPLACDVELGCATMIAIKMSVEAYRQDKVMLWDADAERMIAS